MNAAQTAIRALVVDDDYNIRAICQAILARLGFSVETARDGEEGWGMCQRQTFDLVLSDIHMPGSIDGVKLVESIKQVSPGTDVIIMTGVPDLDTAIPALKLGAYDYLIKPFNQGLLESVIARCLAKRQLSVELQREKIMRAELQAAYAELQSVERIKEAILGRVHHELRTPITVGMLAAECLAESQPDEKGRELAEKVRKSLAELKDKVEDILLYSQLQKGDLVLELSEMDLCAVMRKSVSELMPQCDEKDLAVEVHCDPALGPQRLDPVLVESACKHLFLNAVKFNRKGGRIKVEVKGSGSQALVSFQDTGPGIPADVLPKLSEAFYQVAEFLTRQVGGLGLGLALVRRIAEAHGGGLSVESREGEGSTFTIFLPLR
ncbi:MAG: response regulator [Elusimicrobiota bacterium]|jgi:signal transduction histidine kinase